MKRQAFFLMFAACFLLTGVQPTLAAFRQLSFENCLADCTRHLNALEYTDSAGMTGDEARAGFEKAETQLRKIVSAVATKIEISKARKSANAWAKRGGEEATAYRKVSDLALELIDARETQVGVGAAAPAASREIMTEVDIPWAMIHQQQMEKAVEACRRIIAPFSSEAGFPGKLPPDLQGKTWQEIRIRIAQNCSQCAKIMVELVEKYKLPVRLRLGAMYFRKRFTLGTFIYPHKTETDRIHELQCRTFAGECSEGLKEMSLWTNPEPIWTGDIAWAKPIREGLGRVKALLPEFPESIDEAGAKNLWKQLAEKTVKAGSEAGMTAARVGGFQFPAWRLKFAVKYFKAAAKASVAGNWESRETDTLYWKQACIRLQKAIEPLRAEIDELLASLPN